MNSKRSASSTPETSGHGAGDAHNYTPIVPKSTDYITNEYEQRTVTESEKRTLSFIKESIQRYFLIIRRKLKDSVPKAIMHFLVNYVKCQLSTELVSKLYILKQLEELFEESPGVVEKRKEVTQTLIGLQQINEIINELRDGQFV
jgi:hypothetical protein